MAEAEVAETPAAGGDANKGERATGLTLSECQGLPRVILDSGRIPGHVFERMDFLWRASNCLRLTSPVVSRIYSDQLRKLSAQYEALSPEGGELLPEWVHDSMCDDCGSVLTAGVNCRVRVRHRSLASPCVRRRSRAKAKSHVEKNTAKCLNQVVVTCLVCGGINARGGAERQSRDKKRRRRGGENGGHVTGMSQELSATPQGRKRARVATNLRGNFIPLGGGGSNCTPTPTTKTPAKNRSAIKSWSPAPPPSKPGQGRGSGLGSGSSDSKSRSRGLSGSRAAGGSGRANPLRSPAPAGPAESIFSGPQVDDERHGDGGGGTSGKRLKTGGGGLTGGVGVGTTDLSTGTPVVVDGGDGERIEGAGVQQPALSLLERIRRDAKKRRRQEAAAARNVQR